MSRDRLWVAAAVAYVLVPVFFVVRGADAASYWSWVLGPLFGWIGLEAAGAGLRVGRTAYVLRRRGVVAEGRLEGGVDVPVDEYGATTRHHRYTYTDAEGRRHARTGAVGGAERVDILYDPRDPARTTKVGRGTAGWLAGAGVLLLVPGLPLVICGAGLMAAAVVRALG
ncbi:hypothetical protein ACIRFH_06100 [Streptomyces sp. NPDC093586]|uniref:hypothetical protein n=1 Tax=Streptomyces sp. NPDC093586 TaxID=3366042 RepID=UPI00381CEA6E